MSRGTRRFVTDAHFGLTDIEVEIVRALCEGRSAAGVGAVVGLSEHTVRDYIKTTFRKMNVYSQVTMAIKAERAGLLEGVEP